jgi:hypothetical protein
MTKPGRATPYHAGSSDEAARQQRIDEARDAGGFARGGAKTVAEGCTSHVDERGKDAWKDPSGK